MMAPKGAMGGRLAVAILLATLIVLPVIGASESPELVVDLEINQSTDSVVIAVKLLNDGNTETSVDTDPSCDAYLKVFNSQNDLIRDDSSECRGQSRGLNLAAGQVVDIDTLNWDYTDENGVMVEAGVYELTAVIAGEEISSSQSIIVVNPIQIPEDLQFTFSITQRNNSLESGPVLLTTNLVNTGSRDIALDEFPWCMILIDGEVGYSCNPSQVSIAPYEVILISHERIITDSDSIEVEILGVISETLSIPSSVSSSLPDTLELEVIAGEDGFSLNKGELLEVELVVSNTDTSNFILEFSDSCRAEMWIVAITGEVVMDSRHSRECSEVAIEYLIEPTSEVSFVQPDWAFTDLQGCALPSGSYTLFLEIPEYGALTSQEIEWNNPELASCDSLDDLTADLDVDVDSMMIELNFGQDEVYDLTWTSPCRYLIKISGEEVVFEWRSGCDDRSGMLIRTSEVISETTMLFMLGPNGEEVPSGEYQVTLKSSSSPAIYSTTSFEWRMESTESEPVEEESTEEEIGEEQVAQQRMLIGIWQQENGCWILDSREEGLIAFSSSANIPNWQPRAGWLGQYSVQEAQNADPACEQSRLEHFSIEKVHSETPPLSEDDKEVSEKVEQQSTEIEVPEEVTIAVSAVAATSFFALLIMFIAGNESLRIPATGAGLWLLGLIGRTSETSDGRYQRGRLMGYLTANPGCHFRALMAALSMSNGQITHHLKILEEENKIWRRKDGRLVRFYPFTAELNPDVSDGDLPLPPLSPDPNSLQGKILRLLDDDGQLEEYPTQAELAHRLDRSQQLISHHLRTLHKYGLVEKKRMGLKQRYKLTKEAIFLLDSNEF